MHTTTMYPCAGCGKEFDTLRGKQRHERLHYETPPFDCRVCGRSFPSPDALRRHVKYHTGERSYKCRQCEQQFSLIDDLKEHRRTHNLTYDCEAGSLYVWRTYPDSLEWSEWLSIPSTFF